MKTLTALAAGIACISACSALADLPRWPVEGQRPPGVTKRWFANVDMLACLYDPPMTFDTPYLYKQLYGDAFDPTDTTGSGEILVLGQHNSGTSMVAKLVMLLGAFQGNYETVSISPRNRLKYYEQLSVSAFHDAFLQKFTDPQFRPYHGQSLNFTSLTEADQKAFDCFADKQLADMRRHPPWVMKDPRMALTMKFWRPKLRNPICLFAFKDPLVTTMSLSQNAKKSASLTKGQALMTAQRWMELWETALHGALEACEGVPTIIFDPKQIMEDVPKATQRLMDLLTGVGVKGLKMPTAQELETKVLAHVKRGDRVRRLRTDLGISDKTKLDDSTPVMSQPQKNLEAGLRHYAGKSSEDSGVPPNLVARSILEFEAVTLQADPPVQVQGDRVAGASLFVGRNP